MAAMSTEEPIWKATPSQVVNLLPLILGALVAGALTAVILLTGWLTGGLIYAILPVVWLVCLIPWLWKALKTKFYNYEMTNERLKLTTGIFSRKTDVLELYRVKDMTMDRPFVFRLFGLSNIVLTTSDRTTPTLTIEAIRSGGEVLDTIRNHVELLREKKRVREVDFDSDSDGDGGGVEFE